MTHLTNIARITLLTVVASALFCFALEGADPTPHTKPDIELSNPPYTWQFSKGEEFPGADGKLEIVKQAGKNIATILYDFSGGGAYVAIRVNCKIPEGYTHVEFSITGDTAATVGIRLVDDTGQYFQATPTKYEAIGERKPFRIPIKEIVASGNYFGGAGDHILHYPIKEIQFVINDNGPGSKGKISLEDLLIVE